MMSLILIPSSSSCFHARYLPSPRRMTSATEDNHECSIQWTARTVRVHPGDRLISLEYRIETVIGKGSFGHVYRIRTKGGQELALKKIMVSDSFISRELATLKQIDHPNLVNLMYYSDENDELELYMDYIQDTLRRVIVVFRDRCKLIPAVLIKVIFYQILRGLKFLHRRNTVHRDLKPGNILVDIEYGHTKICDLESAKKLNENETSIAYICSRHYRAPELVMGSRIYTTKVDLWSAGLILAEMFVLHTVIGGDSNLDQLAEMIRVLGTPTEAEIRALNPTFPVQLPTKEAVPWTEILEHKAGTDAVSLVSMLLRYKPSDRIDAWEALSKDFFQEIRSSQCRLPTGKPLPKLNNFTEEELKDSPDLSRLFS